MVLDHVAQRADAVVVARPTFDPERLRHRDLDLVDVRGAQHRLDEPVREPEHQDVLHRLLAEEVVDAEDLVLAPVAVQLLVERERGLEIDAERLLDDEPAPAVGLVGEAGLGDRLGRVGEHTRRQREVEDRGTVDDASATLRNDSTEMSPPWKSMRSMNRSKYFLSTSATCVGHRRASALRGTARSSTPGGRTR